MSRSATSGTEIFDAICERLYETNSRLQLAPVLAAAPPVLSKDKLSYTVQLRQGIRFNDGTPLDAQAVVTSALRFINYPGSGIAGFLANISSVTASGPYTVVYHLKARDSALTFTNLSYVLSPTALAAEGDDFATHPVCVGPFMFDHRVAGDNVTVIKSPYYYDQKDVFLDKIVFKPLPDAAAALAALQAGDVQVLDNVSTASRDVLEQSPSLRVLKAYQLGWSGMQINFGNRSGVGNLPYANVSTPLATSAKLRQAFEEALDRTALNRVVFGGDQQVTCTMIPPADTPWYAATRVPCTPYDPSDARRLVASSGISNPTVRLLVTNATDRVRLAQFVQAQEAAVGFNVVIDLFDNATVLARRGAGNYDVYLGGFSPGGVDPTTTIHLATTEPRNYSGYSNPRLDLILANGLKASDPTARATLYRAAQQIILADRPYIAFYNPSVFAAHSTGVRGVRLTATGLVTVANAQLR